MFPNTSNLNMTNSQDGEAENADSSIVSNNFATPNIPTAAPHDPIRAFLIVLFLLSILFTGSLYGYSVYLGTQVNKLTQDLAAYDNDKSVVSFNSNLNNIRDLSSRLKLLDNIYNKHIYISQMLLPILESITESSSNSYVYFNKFSVSTDQKEAVKVSLSGVTINYESLIRQIKNFKNPAYSAFINSFKLGSLSLDQTGNVLFDVSFDANIAGKSLNDYMNAISNNTFVPSSAATSVKPGPLFQQNASATNTTPVQMETIKEVKPAIATGTIQAGTSSATTTGNHAPSIMTR